MRESRSPSDQARFAFGDNWQRLLDQVTEADKAQSLEDLKRSLQRDSLSGLTFLDVGSGSGLHSLSALRMGAERVVSFDYDEDCVRCCRQLWREEGCPERWEIRQGSVLDQAFLDELGQHDVVYSWGVLHHTGRMWDAIRGAAGCCAPGGLLMIGIYNRKPLLSPLMRLVKRTYVRAGPRRRRLIMSSYFGLSAVWIALKGQNIFAEDHVRGMDRWRDLEDWVGGYPFEYAYPYEVPAFVHPLGFRLAWTAIGSTMPVVNEYLFESLQTAEGRQQR